MIRQRECGDERDGWIEPRRPGCELAVGWLRIGVNPIPADAVHW
jgi:hypothetical protein